MRLTPKQFATLKAMGKGLEPVVGADTRSVLEHHGLIRINGITPDGESHIDHVDSGEQAHFRQTALGRISDRIRECRGCPLHEGTTNAVPGEGNPDARLVFIGEGPGAEEDRLGRPFVGKAGQLLDRMIQAMGLRRDDVLILNTCKHRPPANRTPTPGELKACLPFLWRQLREVEPEVVVLLGNTALKAVLPKVEAGITRTRGKWHTLRFKRRNETGLVIRAMPTFHPAYLLRTPEAKTRTWVDLQVVMRELGLRRPARKKR